MDTIVSVMEIVSQVTINSGITDVSTMHTLRILNANGSCGIDQCEISGLFLTKLKAYNNKKYIIMIIFKYRYIFKN